MTFTDRLTEVWTRFIAWFARLRTDGAGGDRLPGSERDDLVSSLNNGRPAQRWLAAEALGEGDPGRGGVNALIEALESDDPLLRAESGNALARIGGRAVRDALLERSSAGDSVMQAAAADALGKMPADEATVSALQAMLDNLDAVVRQSAAEALACSGWPPLRKSAESRPDPAPRLLDLLAGDPDPMVRRAAALALRKLGDPVARETLVARQDDPAEDWRVREAAALAATRLPVMHAAETPEEVEAKRVEPSEVESSGG